MPQTLRIDKNLIPSNQYSVTLEVPDYGVYRSARRRYPANQERTPYSVEELLLAMAMKEVNDQPLDLQPRDLVDRLTPYPIKDRQFLTIAITDLLFLSKEQAQSAKEIAENLSKQYASRYRIPKGAFPTETLTLEFDAPNSGVQYQVDKRYNGMSEMGCSLEEFLLAYCIATINDEEVEKPKDVISLLDGFTIADVQFAATVFINLFTIGDNDMDDAKKLAGDLRQQLKSGDSDLTEPTTTAPSRKATVS